MSPDPTLLHLVNSYNSGEITRSELQKRVRALPPGLISRVAEILTETSNSSSRRQPMVESVVESRQSEWSAFVVRLGRPWEQSHFCSLDIGFARPCDSTDAPAPRPKPSSNTRWSADGKGRHHCRAEPRYALLWMEVDLIFKSVFSKERRQPPFTWGCCRPVSRWSDMGQAACSNKPPWDVEETSRLGPQPPLRRGPSRLVLALCGSLL